MKSMKRQEGSVAAAMVFVLVMSAVSLGIFRLMLQSSIKQANELQGVRLATIVNVLTKYQSSGGDPTASPPLLPPHEQHNVAGSPFVNGAIHYGLDWLKQSSCSASASAPLELLPCGEREFLSVSDGGRYKFTVVNDGVSMHTVFEVVDRLDETSGLKFQGKADLFRSIEIANIAESRVSFSSFGASTNFFDVDKTSTIISIDVGIDVSNTPYQRRDGITTLTGHQRYETGVDIRAVDTVSANRFALHDTVTDAPSTTRFIDLSGTSQMENIDAQTINANVAISSPELTSTLITANGAVITTALVDDLSVKYIEQTDPNVKNTFAGQIEAGTGSDKVTLANGNVVLDGVIASRSDSRYQINPTGISFVEDIALASRGNMLLSDLISPFRLMGIKTVKHGDLLPLPACGVTGSPRLQLIMKKDSSYFLDNGQITINNNINDNDAIVVGSNFQIRLRTYDPATRLIMGDPVAEALANVYCFYP